MKSYVIKLDHESKNRKLIEKEFNLFGIPFEFISGVGWHELSKDDVTRNCEQEILAGACWCWDEPITFLENYPPGLRKRVACWLSHRIVWQKALKSEDEVFVIFGNDAKLTPRIKPALDKLNSCLSREPLFDIVFLYNGVIREPLAGNFQLENVRDLGVSVFDSEGATGYVITKRAITKLFNDFPIMELSIDQVLGFCSFHGFNTFLLSPPVVFKRRQYEPSPSTSKIETTKQVETALI